MRGSSGWEVGVTGDPDPLENHKAVGLSRNTGMDPLEIHKITQPAFSIGPSSARQ